MLREIPLGGSTTINSASDEDIDEMFLPLYTFTYNLDAGVSLGNMLDQIKEGHSYYTDVWFDPYYVLDNVVITMGGEDITLSAWNGTSISIPWVSYNVSITFETHANPDLVRINSLLENVSTDQDIPSCVEKGSDLSVHIYPGSLTTDFTIHVEINGQDVTNQVWDEKSNLLTLTNIQEEVTIHASAQLANYPVYLNLTDCYSTNGATEVYPGDGYYTIIYSNTGGFDSVWFAMNEQSILGQYASWDNSIQGYIVDIPLVTGPISISCTGSRPNVNISLDLEHVTAENNSALTKEGRAYYNTFFIEQGYELDRAASSITMKEHEGNLIDNLVWNEKDGYMLNIPTVTGDIYISLVATPVGE